MGRNRVEQGVRNRVPGNERWGQSDDRKEKNSACRQHGARRSIRGSEQHPKSRK